MNKLKGHFVEENKMESNPHLMVNAKRFKPLSSRKAQAKVPLRYDSKNGLMPYLVIRIRCPDYSQGMTDLMESRTVRVAPIHSPSWLTVDGTLSNYRMSRPNARSII